jgi:hypothetical protein
MLSMWQEQLIVSHFCFLALYLQIGELPNADPSGELAAGILRQLTHLHQLQSLLISVPFRQGVRHLILVN